MIDLLLSVLFQLLLLVATIATISIILYVSHLNRKLNYWKNIGIPGPKPIAFFGNIHSYFIKTQSEVELEWYRKYGKLYGIYNGKSPVISVAKPELVKQILVKDFHTFRNRSSHPTDHPIASKNLFFAFDDDWKRIRVIVSPTFTSGKLKKLYSLIKECSDEFMDSLDECAKNGKEIELKRLHSAYTLDVIAKCAFATNINTHKDPDNVFSKNARNIFNIKIWKTILVFLMPSFISKYRKIRLLLGLSSDVFINFAKHVIFQRKQNKNETKYNDFIQLLIEAEKSDSISYETDDMAVKHLNEGKDEIEANIKSLKNVNIKSSDKKLTENEILAQCNTFLLAGYETTAATLTYCSYELALHPQIQYKLYEEIKTSFDEKGNIEYDTLNKLPYLDAVISETLRKYPTLLRLERKAMDDVVLGDTGITIPKGMIAEIPIFGIHYDSENYPNPNEFIPERFMPANRSNIKPYTYLPFGTGPRNCIGMRFALLEAKLALANIIKRFVFIKTPNTQNALQFKKNRTLLQSQKPIIMGIKKR